MEIELNYLAIVLATIASMIVGSLWYMPKVFGNRWMKLAGLKVKDMEKNGMKPIMGAILASLVTAFVLAHFTFLAYQFYGQDYSYLMTSLITAFWSWFGFTAVRIWTHDSFEGRSIKLALLNAAHELVTFLAMGWVIGLMGN